VDLHPTEVLIPVAWRALCGVVAFGCAGSSPVSTPKPTRPSVVFISIDTLRADHLGTYGYSTRPTSPHLDGLAQEAVVFEQHQSTAPWTTPSHLSMMSGLYPSHHGVMQPYFELVTGLEGGGKVDALEDSRTTLAELLAAEGYRTAAFTGGGAVDPSTGLGQGFTRYETDHYKLTDANLADLDTWLGEADGPFFLFWHTFEVHAPYTDGRFLQVSHAPEAPAFDSMQKQLLELDGLLRHQRPSEANMGKAHQWMAKMLGDHGMRTPEVTLALYDGGIAAMDHRLGQLVDMLKRRGIYDNCVLVVTSDHGDEFTDHHPYYYDAHGHSLYEELIHTPLIVKLPHQSEGGRRVSQRVSSVDLLPTIAALVSVEAPPALDGRSLVPLLHGDATVAQVPVYSEALNDRREMKAVHDGDHKLIVTIPADVVAREGRLFLPESPEVELYRTAEDPREETDLSGQHTTAALLDAVRGHVAGGRRSSASAPMDAETVKQLEAMGYLEQPSERPELRAPDAPAPQ